MAKSKSTKLRHISSTDVSLVEMAVERLAFKVEIKEITKIGKRYFVFFTVEDHINFKSVDL